MNDELNIDVKTLNPFRRFIYTIGALPSSYLISMTYEEQLIWFCNYLEKTVIPTINNNGLAVEELQAKYIELKNYVDNYFDNLDVQEEINNKLDEMAESGELTDIIAQYLELAGVLAYNTLSELEAATNVSNGSICMILGKTSYNDGKTTFYKIRTILNTDVIDGDNIIAITNDDTLVGEKIPNYSINQINNELTNINNDINDINDNLDVLNNKTNGIIGLTRLGTAEAWNFVYSPNGIDFYPVGENTTDTVGDSSALIEIEGTFYIVGSNRYKYSKDLVNWSEEQFILEGYTANTYPRVWANTFCYDEVNHIVYSYAAYQYANQDFPLTVINQSTGHYPFKIIYQTGTINNDGSITFDQNIHELLYEADESFYDPFVINDKVHGLVMACVRSTTLQVEIRRMTNFTTLSGTTIISPAVGVEAPQLITDNQGNIYCYVDCNWACTDTTINGGSYSPHVNGYFTVAHTGGFYNTNQMRLIPYKWYCDSYFRHLGITNASKHALNCAEKIGIKIVPTHIGQNSNCHNGRIWEDCANNGVIINSPCVIWNISGSANVTVRTLFKNEPLVFKGASNIGWKSDGNISDWCKGKHFTGQYSRQQITVYPDASSGIMDVPFTD